MECFYKVHEQWKRKVVNKGIATGLLLEHLQEATTKYKQKNIYEQVYMVPMVPSVQNCSKSVRIYEKKLNVTLNVYILGTKADKGVNTSCNLCISCCNEKIGEALQIFDNFRSSKL